MTETLLLDYVEFVRSRLSQPSLENPLDTACFGLAGEAGEFIDLVKKTKFQGKEFDKEKAIRELGDVLFYTAVAAIALEVPLSEVIQTNIDKLTTRYPAGFTVQNSEVRKPSDD
jgi:NTP pyrophosphatase (non-canonical NTP hydrolase)